MGVWLQVGGTNTRWFSCAPSDLCDTSISSFVLPPTYHHHLKGLRQHGSLWKLNSSLWHHFMSQQPHLPRGVTWNPSITPPPLSAHAILAVCSDSDSTSIRRLSFFCNVGIPLTLLNSSSLLCQSEVFWYILCVFKWFTITSSEFRKHL